MTKQLEELYKDNNNFEVDNLLNRVDFVDNLERCTTLIHETDLLVIQLEEAKT